MDSLKLLQKLGMTEYESRAYLSLARLGPSTVRDIVLDSKLPRNKAYEALEKLEQKNKVVSLPLSPRKYKITDPESLKEDVEELHDSINLLLEMIKQPKATEFQELFWVIKGKKAIEEKIRRQNLEAKREIVGCNKLSRVLYSNLRTGKEAIEKGVKIKMITTFEKKNISQYRMWLRIGAELRVFNDRKFGPLLPRITVFDGEIARLTIGEPEIPNDEEYLTIWSESKSFSLMLRNHFMNMWRNSEPIEKYLKR